jgi:hypothetical protein
VQVSCIVEQAVGETWVNGVERCEYFCERIAFN